MVKIQGSESSTKHAKFVWNKAVLEHPASHVGIIAHSAGGWDTHALAAMFKDDFEKRVFSALLTDSPSSLMKPDDPAYILKSICVNFVAHEKCINSLGKCI